MKRGFRVVWMIERRPLRGSRTWRAIEWPDSKKAGLEKAAAYNRLVADCEYRVTRYEPCATESKAGDPGSRLETALCGPHWKTKRKAAK